jgi:diguanylate cyclase (GGDEF)-like protein
MKLQSKVLIILASMWAVISLIIYIDSKVTLTRDYEKLEKTQVIRDINRAQKVLNNMMTSLKLLNKDWARWDDAYDFMKTKNPKFIQSNLIPATYENQQINFILFFDKTGKLFFGQNYDLREKKMVPIPDNFLRYLSNHPAVTQQKNVDDGTVGFVKIPEGNAIISSMPVLTSNSEGPIFGSLLMGYLLDKDHVQKIADTMELKIDFFFLPFSDPDKSLNKTFDELAKGAQYVVTPKNSTAIYGYTLLNDIDGQPIGILRMEIPRTLFNEGIMTINHYLAIVISLGIIVLITMWQLLKSFVLNRVVSVSNQVVKINSESNFSKRIQTYGNDELHDMVRAINSMLEIIELSQEQLKYRISQHSDKLERLSKLNKNLFNEMSNQKSLQIKLQEGEKLLRHMAYCDALTGLHNRAYLNEFLQETLDRTKETHSISAILFLDLDKFKSINDTHGHMAGDHFLKHVAEMIQKSIDSNAIAVRLSGDEFIILVKNVKEKIELTEVINKLLINVSTPATINNQFVSTTASIGISLFPQDGETPEDLIKHADLAMYYAKKQSGNSFCFYDMVPEKIL